MKSIEHKDEQSEDENGFGYSNKPAAALSKEFITMYINGQVFGIPVVLVQDVLKPQKIARIPMAPPAVAGSLNLRGRIVTALDLRVCLGLPPRLPTEHPMSIVVENKGEAYNFLIDKVGEVLFLSNENLEPNPSTMEPNIKEFSMGVYRLEENLLIILDAVKILEKMT